jgi:hypothetical protein
VQRVFADPKSSILRDFLLALLDLRIIELFDPTALQANQVIVMPALVELENRLAAFEMMAPE